MAKISLIIIALSVFLSYFLVSFLLEHRKRLQSEKKLVAEMKDLQSALLHEKENLKNTELYLIPKLAQSEESIKQLTLEIQQHKSNLSTLLESNLTSIPWLAGMIADFITYDIEVEAKKLDWGSNARREKKVASLREIRANASQKIEQAKEASYQLAYLLTLYPGLEDILSLDYKELDFSGQIPDHDYTMDYLSKEEWEKLSSSERDQLALDRYIQSRKKNNWQIGRDYELSVAFEYRQKGYDVDTFGSYMQLEDLGRDLIAKKSRTILIIQCKYWSKNKTIHEKHIFYLYGTTISYCLEHDIPLESVHGIFVTNTILSDMAKKVADQLGIYVVENHQMVEFPRIKCNIGRDEFGEETKIYHLPMDQLYDRVKITKNGEFFAYTVEEAISAGFRRAYKWHGK